MVNGEEEESKVRIGERATGKINVVPWKKSGGRKRMRGTKGCKRKRMVNGGEEESKVRIGGRATGRGRGRKMLSLGRKVEE